MDKTYICQCCGKPFIKTLVPDAYLGNNCFDCSFWLRKIDYSEELGIPPGPSSTVGIT